MPHHLNSAVTLFAALLATAACLPVTSKSPIGTTAGYRADPQLTGMWMGRSNGQPAWFEFFPQSDGSTKVVMLDPSARGRNGDWLVFDVHTATLGPDHFMDASEIEENGKAPGQKLEHMPVLYRFGADGSLALRLLDEDAVKAAVRAGRIAGVVEPGQYGDVVLTATPAMLDAFLQTQGRALFDKPPVILERVKP